MSTIMQESTFLVREFSTGDVNFRVNHDMPMQLRKGENEYGQFGEAVLVKIGLDDGDYNDVEVCTGGIHATADADTIDAAIESLIVIRDALRKMAATA